MSDSTKTILWIALAVVVVLVIVGVVRSSRKKRRVLDERRFQAGELRAEAQQKTPLLQESADRASVTERIAADARAEADEKAAAATALESQAHAHRAKADGVRAERDDLAREADRIDPDVDTDDEGHRVGPDAADVVVVGAKDDADQAEGDPPQAETPAGSRPAPDAGPRTASDSGPSDDTEAERDGAAGDGEPAGTASGSGREAAVGTGVLGGASALDDHDDEPDLADAEDPFTTTGEERPADGYDDGMDQTGSTDDTTTSSSATSRDVDADVRSADGLAETHDEALDEKAAETAEAAEAADGPTADQSDPVTDDDARDHAVTGDIAPVDDATQEAGDLDAARAEASGASEGTDGTDGTDGASADASDDEDASDGAAASAEANADDEADSAEGSSSEGPPVATATHPKKVSVPALDDRDEVLVAGGPPNNDPGDHRGQTWATTPGDPGLDEGDDIVENPDEGLAVHTLSDAAVDSDNASDHSDNASELDTERDTDSDAEPDAAPDEAGAPGDRSADRQGNDSGEDAPADNDNDNDDSGTPQDDLSDAATPQTVLPSQAGVGEPAESTEATDSEGSERRRGARVWPANRPLRIGGSRASTRWSTGDLASARLSRSTTAPSPPATRSRPGPTAGASPPRVTRATTTPSPTSGSTTRMPLGVQDSVARATERTHERRGTASAHVNGCRPAAVRPTGVRPVAVRPGRPYETAARAP